jgi:hypothetical protein
MVLYVSVPNVVRVPGKGLRVLRKGFPFDLSKNRTTRGELSFCEEYPG